MPRKLRHQFTGPRSMLRIERILAALIDNPMTARELSAKLFMSYATATLYLAHLQTNPRRVRIASYRPPEGQGRPSPVYALGRNKNAVEVALSGAEKRSKYKAQRDADPELRNAYLSKRRARDWRARRAAGRKPRETKDPLQRWVGISKLSASVITSE